MVKYENVFRENQMLQTDRLVLRPFSMDDVMDVFLYASNKDVTKYLTWEAHTDLLQTEKTIKELYINSPGTYAIELRSENKCIGCIDLRLDKKNNKGSFGYVLNQNYWGQGYMSEALMITLNFAFAKLNLNRIQSTHYVGNEASGFVMQKCGMKYEGMGLEEVKVKGIYHDVVHYAILKCDWMANPT